ncbi:hypothetical protein WS90_24645 [Burkholderia cepacia]|uniref:Uncharacterized protein n=1 Tax=Burkholderia cepacia TaxID=292 RepID=A0A103ZAU5_BURCE|nr:hypothetical protein WS90_24645 [Burkholderia cepacia]
MGHARIATAAPRRDLSMPVRVLEATERGTCGRQYDGVPHIMPRPGRIGEQAGILSAETSVGE